MAIEVDEETFLSSSSNTKTTTPQHEGLITDTLLARALRAILDVCDTEGYLRARQMREQADFTLGEAIQVLRYLHQQGVLDEEREGRRVVNRSLARDYLSIIAPTEALAQIAPEETSFSQAQIAWACMHARDKKLTSMRIARPSKWTIALAQALSLTSSNITGELILPTSRAQRLCLLVEQMPEAERARLVDWAEHQLQQRLRISDQL